LTLGAQYGLLLVRTQPLSDCADKAPRLVETASSASSAATIDDANRFYDEQVARYPGRLVVLRGGASPVSCPIRRSDGKRLDLVI